MFIALLACGVIGDDRLDGSETHFLSRCSETCGSSLECLDGVCTRACQAGDECQDLNPAATCDAPRGSCQIACSVQGGCSAQDTSLSCERDRCVSFHWAPEVCPNFAGGLQTPVDVEATVDFLAEPQNVLRAAADGGGFYWVDEEGAMFGLGAGEVVRQLRLAQSEPFTLLGLLLDANFVYFAEAGRDVSTGPMTPGPPPPPSRIYRVARAGGEVELLLELEAQLMEPLAINEGTPIVQVDTRLHEVREGGLRLLDHLPEIEGEVKVVDGRVYWSQQTEGETLQVLAASLAGGPAEVLATIEGRFQVAHGRVFWAPEQEQIDPLVLVQHFVMRSIATGCQRELPSLGESIGQSLIDRNHVYWMSYNALGGDNPGDPSALIVPLVRVNLSTGRLERVVTPGFNMTLTRDLLAQDDSTLYVRDDEGGVVLVRKPD